MWLQIAAASSEPKLLLQSPPVRRAKSSKLKKARAVSQTNESLQAGGQEVRIKQLPRRLD